MKVLIGCEESGVGRRAFEKRGHEVISVDLKPPRDGARNHHCGDIVEFLGLCPNEYYDLGIFHPECTKVAVCGNRTWAGTVARTAQIEWICNLWELAKLKCRRVCFENPASVIWRPLRGLGAAVQYVQPWQFGHMEQKKTGLGLHNLPPLRETENVYEQMMQLPKSQRERVFYMSPGQNRSRDRSQSYAGILEAMADQWQ